MLQNFGSFSVCSCKQCRLSNCSRKDRCLQAIVRNYRFSRSETYRREERGQRWEQWWHNYGHSDYCHWKLCNIRIRTSGSDPNQWLVLVKRVWLTVDRICTDQSRRMKRMSCWMPGGDTYTSKNEIPCRLVRLWRCIYIWLLLFLLLNLRSYITWQSWCFHESPCLNIQRKPHRIHTSYTLRNEFVRTHNLLIWL